MKNKILNSSLSEENKLVLIYLNHIHEIFHEYKKFPQDGFVPVMVFEKESFLADSYDLATLNQQFFTLESLEELKKYSEFRQQYEDLLNQYLPKIGYSSIAICPSQGSEEEDKFTECLEKIYPYYDTYLMIKEKYILENSLDNQHNNSETKKLKL